MKEINMWVAFAIMLLLGGVECCFFKREADCRDRGGVLVQRLPFGTACVVEVKK